MNLNKKEDISTNNKTETLSAFLTVITYFQLILWLNSLEKMTYGVGYKPGPIGWATLLTLSIGVLFLLILFFKYGSWIQKTMLVCFCIFLGINIFFGFFDQYLGSIQHSFTRIEQQHIINQINEKNPPELNNLTILYHDASNSMYIIGKERHPKQKHLTLHYSNHERFESSPQTIENLSAFVPGDFSKYRETIEGITETKDPIILFEDFLKWQFPDYVTMLILENKLCPTPDGLAQQKCIYQLYEKRDRKHLGSLWEDLMTRGLKTRFIKLASLIKEYFGQSTPDQKKLQNDPYFLRWQNKSDQQNKPTISSLNAL